MTKEAKDICLWEHVLHFKADKGCMVKVLLLGNTGHFNEYHELHWITTDHHNSSIVNLLLLFITIQNTKTEHYHGFHSIKITNKTRARTI